ncbi:asparagine synthase-related protein [Comamonadaceae bacterium G21597-S1]|nr:asparagine synthase-related protein [Comamonadaceae bacterium G21597-S1]
MSSIDASLSYGSPVFADAQLAEIADQQGSIAAWREALKAKPEVAARAVSGAFAIGLYQAGEDCFLAVDRFATCSLCYRIDKGRLTFAARADELADASTPIEPQAIFDYLYFHCIPSPRTIFKGIHRLPPGHFAEFKSGQLTVKPYWEPRFQEQQTATFDTLKDEFRQLLQDAVRAQFDGNKVGCFLSGGTDSSTVAGMAGLANSQPAATYSIGFHAQGYDEMEFARIAAKHFNTEHHEYYVTPADLVGSIPSMAAHFDQPFGNSSALPAYFCAKMARDDGVSKLLAGDGGDELFGGNSRYAKQRVFSWYENVPGILQHNLLEPLLSTRAAAAVPLTRKANSYVEQARTPMPDRLQMYNLIMRLGPAEVLTPAMLAQVDTTAPLQLHRQVWQAPDACSLLNRELAFDWRFTLAESDLPKVNSAVGFAGISVGFPLLDTRLLDFSLRLPTEYKLKGLKLRWFFKEALRGFLPDEIITKKKQGFGLPFGVWAHETPALRQLATESLESLAARGVVRPDFIATLMGQKLAEHPGYFGEMVWILMMLEQWLANHAPDFKIEG